MSGNSHILQRSIYQLTVFCLLFGTPLLKAQKSAPRSFRFSDSTVTAGQSYRLFDLQFSGADSSQSVQPDRRLDSLVQLVNRLKINNLMVAYVHYSEQGDQDKACLKKSWHKAQALSRYLRSHCPQGNIFPKTLCYKADLRSKIELGPQVRNPDEFAEIFIVVP